jgi:hypothetical protein
MSKQNNIYFKDFSTAMDFFYDYGVEEIVNFNFWEQANGNEKITNYNIDFAMEGGDPGYVKFVCVLNKVPIYEIALLCDDLILHMFWYEFEIIRPYIIDSRKDVVKHYNVLSSIFRKYQSGEIKLQTNPFYFEFLKMYLELNKSTVEEIMAMSVKGKQQTDDWRSLIDVKNDYPINDKDKNANIDLLDKILLN